MNARITSIMDTNTPGKNYPKPPPTAFGSTGLLQKKTRSFLEKGSIHSNTPETPIKTERSKFLVPSNLTPFALSPLNLVKKASSLPKNTNRPTNLVEGVYSTRSFEKSLLNSPCELLCDSFECCDESNISSELYDASMNVFIEKSSINGDFMDICSRTETPPNVNFSDYTTAYHWPIWKSPKVNFLNEEYFEERQVAFASEFSDNDNMGSRESCIDYFSANFEIIEMLGHGSFSFVYKVKSKSDGHIYAVKKSKYTFTGFADRYAQLFSKSLAYF